MWYKVCVQFLIKRLYIIGGDFELVQGTLDHKKSMDTERSNHTRGWNLKG